MSESMEEATGSKEQENIDFADFGAKWMEEVFGKFGLSIDVKGEEAGGDLSFDIHGTDADKLAEGLGLPPGKLIAATQTVLGTVLQRQGWGRGELVLDVRGIQRRRSQGLGSVANILTEKVALTGKSITVLGMGSPDRKVIHKRLEASDGVMSESEGFGPLRRLKVKHR